MICADLRPTYHVADLDCLVSRDEIRHRPVGAKTETATREWLPAAGHGLDDLDVGRESDETMLAFLHVAEKSAASRFTVYSEVLHSDPGTQQVFNDKLYEIYFRFLETEDEYFAYAPAPVPPQGRWNIYGLSLPEPVLRKVYWSNAARLLGLT